MEKARLERKIDDFLMKWKANENRKPLILQGARQVGKTEAIRHLGATYESFVEINFKLEPQYKKIISNDTSNTADSIIKEISNINPSFRFLPKKTLILFDEIQAFPEICTSLKSFCENRKYDVICSGFLLGINYSSISSVAVGYKEDEMMFGLDFEEFLWSIGYPKSLRSDLLKAMVSKTKLSDALFETLKSHFYDFSALGGMPEVVWNFVSSGNFSGSQKTQRQILRDYREDMKTYAEGLDKARIEAIFESIPVQLGKENPKFQLSRIKKRADYREFAGIKEWLSDAGIILISYGLNFPELPLKGNYQLDNFRLYYADTGLLIASLDDEVQNDLRINKNLGVYKGAIYENIIAVALAKQGLPLYFYKRSDGTLEEEFFLRSASHLIPLEAKSGNSKAKSLRTLVDSNKYPDISFGIKMADANIGESNGITTFPFFLSFLLKDYLSSLN